VRRGIETKTKVGPRRPFCPKCGRGTLRYRLRKDNYWCLTCGWQGTEPTWKGTDSERNQE
jgi:ribosomal protein L37AE/L43A